MAPKRSKLLGTLKENKELVEVYIEDGNIEPIL
jgi:hypothetical protein